MTKEIKIPFDKEGNMLDYPQTQTYYYHKKTGLEETDWLVVRDNRDNYNFEKIDIFKDNEIFEDELQYVGYHTSRSSVRFIFKSLKNNKTYSMFLSEFDRIIHKKKLIGGVISGNFNFIKQGANFSIKLLD